jgi:hypothetical protein
MSDSSNDHPPAPGNDNENPLHRADTALIELHRLRRDLVAKDKTGYSADQWQRYSEALAGLDEAISLVLPYL